MFVSIAPALIMGLVSTTSTPFLAVAVLVFMGSFVSSSRMNVTLSLVKTEEPAWMAWAPIVATVLLNILDTTAR